MRLYEFESKKIFQMNNIPIPKGQVVSSANEISAETPSVIKAQIPSGGRGKALKVMKITLPAPIFAGVPERSNGTGLGGMPWETCWLSAFVGSNPTPRNFLPSGRECCAVWSVSETHSPQHNRDDLRRSRMILRKNHHALRNQHQNRRPN